MGHGAARKNKLTKCLLRGFWTTVRGRCYWSNSNTVLVSSTIAHTLYNSFVPPVTIHLHLPWRNYYFSLHKPGEQQERGFRHWKSIAIATAINRHHRQQQQQTTTTSCDDTGNINSNSNIIIIITININININNMSFFAIAVSFAFDSDISC